MKKSIKVVFAMGLLSATIFAACKKEQPVPDVITYELTLQATKSVNGSTTFTEIKYMDGNKTTQTLTNSSTDFSTKFAVRDSFPISFSVKGTASGGSATTLPTPTISYKVEKITNGTTRDVVCNEFEASIKGTSSGYTFEKVFTKVVSPTGCK